MGATINHYNRIVTVDRALAKATGDEGLNKLYCQNTKKSSLRD